MAETIKIGGELESTATGNVVAAASAIKDKVKNKYQGEINAEVDETLANHSSAINGLNSQNYVTVTATDQTTSETDVLPATGSVDTVYRVGNWDGTQYDETCYSEYAWNGSTYKHLSTKTQVGEVFDISAAHATGGILATYDDLAAALGTNGANVPQELRKGGMSVKYVQSSDNNYVQFRFMLSGSFTDAQFTNGVNWQGVDEEPTPNSKNLVESDGSFESIEQVRGNTNIRLQMIDEYPYNGKYIIYSDGSVVDNANYSCTSYIKIDKTKLLNIKGGCSSSVAAVAFYDIDKTFISAVQGSTNYDSIYTYSNVTIPQNAVYARFTTGNTVLSSSMAAYANGESFNDRIINNSKKTLANLVDTLNSSIGYLSTTGEVVSQGSGKYRYVKLSLNTGIYAISLQYTGTQHILWRFKEAACTNPIEKIIGNVSGSYQTLVELEEGYYVLAWTCDNLANNNYTNDCILNYLGKTYDDYKRSMIGLLTFSNSSLIPYYGTDGTTVYNNENRVKTQIIKVSEGESYEYRLYGYTSTFSITAFDANMDVITSKSMAFNGVSHGVYTIQNGVYYIQFVTAKDTTYSSYYTKRCNNPIDKYSASIEKLSGARGNNAYRVTANSLVANGSLVIESFPCTLKKGHVFSFYAEFSDNNFGQGFRIGFGKTNTLYKNYLIIDASNITHVDQLSGEGTPIPHGLTMQTYVKIAACAVDGKLHINLTTLNGMYEGDIETWGYAVNGDFRVVARESSSFSNCTLSIGNSEIKKPVWAFGDSYFHFHWGGGIMYWLHDWGYDHMLVAGYGGQGSEGSYNELLKLLDIGIPKYIVWALGMNDNYSSWLEYFVKVRSLCAAYDIEMIACTVPVVKDTSYTGKQDMTDYVRSCGLRYIDVYKAVGCNSSGEWYNNGTDKDYQNTDGVHPSARGGRAIAMQWLVDFPEIMQYEK